MKVRRIDFSADEFIAGITGKLTVVDLGVYWLVCSLIYSHGGPIDDDEKWIAAIFRDTNPRTVRAAIERLILMSKIQRMGGELMVNRCRKELERASNRVRTWTENGSKGGRPSNKINEIAEPNGLSENNRASNHQPSTINHQRTIDISASAESASSEVSGKEKRRAKIDPGWKPSTGSFVVGKKEGFSEQEIQKLGIGFVDYWTGAGKPMADWDRTFNNHLRSSMAHSDVTAWRRANGSGVKSPDMFHKLAPAAGTPEAAAKAKEWDY